MRADTGRVGFELAVDDSGRFGRRNREMAGNDADISLSDVDDNVLFQMIMAGAQHNRADAISRSVQFLEVSRQ